MIRSQKDIYRLLEKHMQGVTEPMTCVDLMDIFEIEQEALNEFGSDKRTATNKLSDTLGFMWRRGILARYPTSSEKGQMARYAYVWANSEKEESKPEAVQPPVRSKTGVIVTEREDGVLIEFDKFFLFVRPK